MQPGAGDGGRGRGRGIDGGDAVCIGASSEGWPPGLPRSAPRSRTAWLESKRRLGIPGQYATADEHIPARRLRSANLQGVSVRAARTRAAGLVEERPAEDGRLVTVGHAGVGVHARRLAMGVRL